MFTCPSVFHLVFSGLIDSSLGLANGLSLSWFNSGDRKPFLISLLPASPVCSLDLPWKNSLLLSDQPPWPPYLCVRHSLTQKAFLNPLGTLNPYLCSPGPFCLLLLRTQLRHRLPWWPCQVFLLPTWPPRCLPACAGLCHSSLVCGCTDASLVMLRL